MKKPISLPSQHNTQHPEAQLSATQSVNPGLPILGSALRRRNYMPGLARFLSQVRLAEQLGGEHPYAYAMNNPVTYIDPSGLQPCGSSDPCDNYNKEYKKYNRKPFWDQTGFGNSVNKALSSCKNYNKNNLKTVLICIIERESSDHPGSYKFPLPETGGGVTGPCQLSAGTDKRRICGAGWNHSLQSHLNCCAKLLCRCLNSAGGNLITGCGFGPHTSNTWQVINEDIGRTKPTSSLNPDFKCCLKKRGWPDPGHIVPK